MLVTVSDLQSQCMLASLESTQWLQLLLVLVGHPIIKNLNQCENCTTGIISPKSKHSVLDVLLFCMVMQSCCAVRYE